ncbi:hypothetical protein CFU_3719 [Collimonas fungivorans Ter331]|uniref:Uncharacterized protein n=1 Tax=Collimonas fungivorans (strain Ter331) TaxID=1005048 RepID=G0ADK1_COLFT|nr:hypothetical protein CFU_3719 [Collimonas fungivorans Ter331]
MQIVELAPHVRPACCFADRTVFKQRIEAGVMLYRNLCCGGGFESEFLQ